jgi:hypothetical protein
MKNIKNLIFCGLIALAAVTTFAGCPTDDGAGTGDAIPLDPPKSNLYIGNAAAPENDAGTTLKSNLDWLGGHAEDNGVYTIKVNSSGSIGGIEVSTWGFFNKGNVSITLTTASQAEVIIALNANGRLFRVVDYIGKPVTLTLGGSITLRGLSSNTSELILVAGSGAALNLTENAKITSNNAGGGVLAESGGKIIMSGGKISGNNGGGVTVRGGGTTFTMSGGEISGNAAANGGGVKVENGAAFTMSDTAVISGNTGTYNGGGVSANGASFTMLGGTIRNNTARQGGGVYIGGGTFSKTGGVIYGDTDNIHTPGSDENTVPGNGGGCAAWLTTPNGTLNRVRNSTAGEDDNMSWDGTNQVGFNETTNAG